MKILYHHRTQGKGVEGVHIRGLVNALRDLNHDVTVMSPPGCDPFYDGEIQTHNKQKFLKKTFAFISGNCPEFLFEVLELVYNLSAYIRLRYATKRTEYDLIYERYFLFSISSLFISKKRNIPVIYEVNDSSFVSRLRKLKLVRLANALEKMVLSNASYLITVSAHFKKTLIDNHIPEERIGVCHNAVDPHIFSDANIRPVHTDLPADRYTIGFLGSFVKWASVHTLVHAYSSIRRKYPKTHLLLVGDGPEKENVLRVVSDLNLQSHVTIVGPVDHVDVPSYIDLMDICVIPRHERYTSPVKLFEYMAMSKPILAPANEGISEVIEPRLNGMLFEPDSEDDFISTLAYMIDNKDLCESLGKNASKNIVENYSWGKNALQIEKVLRTIKQRPL